MSNISERTERLITRKLDSELTDEESLELSAEILRNPAAHRYLEDCERIDGLAAEALGAYVGGESTGEEAWAISLAASNRRMAARLSYSRAWWVLPGAVAAALLLALVRTPIRPTVPDDGISPSPFDHQALVTHTSDLSGSTPGKPDSGFEAGTVRTSTAESAPPRRVIKDTARNLIGVIGDDGRIYWLEIDHTRTRRDGGPGALTGDPL